MKKRFSYFPYNERSRSSWTLSTPRHLALSPIRSIIKTVTHVSGTPVTYVSGLYTLLQRGVNPIRTEFLTVFHPLDYAKSQKKESSNVQGFKSSRLDLAFAR